MKKVIITTILLGVCGAVGVGIWWKHIRTEESPLPVRIMLVEYAVSDMVQALSADFTKETGIPVVVEQVPFARWQKVAYSEFATHHPRFDLVAGDSQWMGYGVTNGYYANLTDFVKEHKIDGTFSELSTKDYGEYPPQSGQYYAIPFSGSAIAYAYRKDWFEDPAEKSAFLSRYGYELRAPRTTDELHDVAEFFYRPAEGRYGFVFQTGSTHDSVSMSYGSFLFGFGGSWGERAVCAADGFVNNEGAVKALDFLKTMYGFTPPNSTNLGFSDAMKSFTSGNTAMLMNPVAGFLQLTSTSTNPYVQSTGYFGTVFGPKSQYGQLTGQGLSLLRDASNPDGARKFMEWWIRKDTQEKFAAHGGLTTHREVIQTDMFKQATPYNAAYSDSIELVHDYWNTPSYDALLLISQKYLNAYITGATSLTAKDILDTIVREWQPILQKDCK